MGGIHPCTDTYAIVYIVRKLNVIHRLMSLASVSDKMLALSKLPHFLRSDKDFLHFLRIIQVIYLCFSCVLFSCEQTLFHRLPKQLLLE